jgi:hypothetical protein
VDFISVGHSGVEPRIRGEIVEKVKVVKEKERGLTIDSCCCFNALTLLPLSADMASRHTINV